MSSCSFFAAGGQARKSLNHHRSDLRRTFQLVESLLSKLYKTMRAPVKNKADDRYFHVIISSLVQFGGTT